MVEEAQTENKQEESKIEEESPIDEAKQILEENKKVLNDLKEERVKLEKAAANIALSGKSFAGKQEKKEETPREYKDRIMRGG